MKHLFTTVNISLVAAFVWLVGCTSIDPDSLPRDEAFVKYYGTLESDELVDLLVLDDGYLLLGTTRRNLLDKDYLLIRTDLEGNEVLRRTFEFQHPYTWVTEVDGNNNPTQTETLFATGDDVPSRMHLYDDTQLVIIGTADIQFESSSADVSNVTRTVFNRHAFVVHIDLTALENLDNSFVGVDTAAIRYQHSDGSLIHTDGADIVFHRSSDLSEEHFFILGSADTGLGDDPKSIWLMKTDLTFSNPVWSNLYGFQSVDEGKRLITHGDGDALRFYYAATISSTGSQGGGLLDVQVLEFNPINGTPTGPEIIIGGRENDVPESISLFRSGFALIGNTDTDPAKTFIFELSLGLIAGDSVSFETDFGNSGRDITQADDGGLWFVGNVNRFVEDGVTPKLQEGILGKLRQNADVDLDRTKYYGGDGDDVGNAVIQLSDGSILIGATIDFGLNAKMMALIKTNRLGEIED